MATASAKRPSKSDFVRQILQKDPRANRRAVEEAWLAAGHEGPISSALVSTLRRKLGLMGNGQGSSKPADGNGAAESKATARTSKTRRAASKRRGKAPTQGSGAQAATKQGPGPGNRRRVLAEIEGDIDRLIFKLMGFGGLEDIEGGLRKVRHLLYRSQEA
jgi:hypothetical protein